MVKLAEFTHEQYNKVNRYLSLVQRGRRHPEIVTPEAVYKLSLMALDKLTINFLGFYEILPKSLGTVALIRQVQEVVYIDDSLINELVVIIEDHDRGVKTGVHAEAIDEAQAHRVYELIRRIYRELNPYLPG